MTSCNICINDFTWDVTARNKSRLPVQSRACPHVFCHSCILKLQASEGERSGRIVLLEKLKCPACRAPDAFEPERPIVCLIACELLAERATLASSHNNHDHNSSSSSLQLHNVAPALKAFSSKSKRALLTISKTLSNSSRSRLMDSLSSSRTREEYFRREQQLTLDMSTSSNQHTDEEHRVVMVSGAGQPRVNGIYEFDGYFENAVKFSMMTPAGEYSLFRCRINESTMCWYLSLVPRNKQPGSNTDVDFYVARVNNFGSEGRGSNPWSCTNWAKSSYGLDPPPTLDVLEC